MATEVTLCFSVKTERQPTEWEKIFVNCTCNKGLMSRLYKELQNLVMNK
jgi:hypothetical protein